ncbi:hypothetical protein FACS189467_7820 [Bacteroidia bacterium]|nr:hypothetical protein FACS189467_7820 [Bacteroidia bacterium]
MRLFAVTGNPILHSKSPLLFGAAYPDNKQDFCYFRLHADSADEALKTFTEIGLSGMNVTAPFKSDILQLIETRSDTTVALNACNTIVATEKGLYADNTDTEGVSGAIHQAGTTIANARCLVLGAGGAGSAAAYALHKAGGIVTIANRTIATAQALSKKIGCSFCGLDDLAEKMAYAEIIVNTLSSDVIALLEQPVFICGTGSLLTRPLNMIADALQQFGAKISSEQGKLPLSIQGKMRGGTAHIDGSSGSQLLTGLLMALPLADDVGR